MVFVHQVAVEAKVEVLQSKVTSLLRKLNLLQIFSWFAWIFLFLWLALMWGDNRANRHYACFCDSENVCHFQYMKP